MGDGKLLEGLKRFGKAAKDSGIIDLAIDLTPVGKAKRIVDVIGNVLGVDKNPDTVAEAIEAGLSPEDAVRVREAVSREVEAYEETKREILRTEQEEFRNVTSRHAADMMSDSKLSKTWRPVAGYIIIGAFIVDHIVWRVALLMNKQVESSELLYQLAFAVVGFYFGSRGLQHVASKFAAKWSGNLK